MMAAYRHYFRSNGIELIQQDTNGKIFKKCEVVFGFVVFAVDYRIVMRFPSEDQGNCGGRF